MNNEFDRQALWCVSYGLYVVTSHFNNKLNGQIANTVFQVTAEPPRIAVSINKNNLTHEYISNSGVFAASVLDESAPLSFIGLFGFKSGRDIDKFSEITFDKGITGCPLVTEYSLSVFEAKVIKQIDAGTHTIFIGDVLAAKVLKEGRPLTYAYYQEIKKGKSPKSAPTYHVEKRKEESVKGRQDMKKYTCDLCGYVYDPAAGDPENGIAAGTPFENLPDDWVCPVCGAAKDQFSPEA